MQTDTLIVGGGLSGLALTAKLQKAGQSFLVVEAAERLGGVSSLRMWGTRVSITVLRGSGQVSRVLHDTLIAKI